MNYLYTDWQGKKKYWIKQCSSSLLQGIWPRLCTTSSLRLSMDLLILLPFTLDLCLCYTHRVAPWPSTSTGTVSKLLWKTHLVHFAYGPVAQPDSFEKRCQGGFTVGSLRRSQPSFGTVGYGRHPRLHACGIAYLLFPWVSHLHPVSAACHFFFLLYVLLLFLCLKL